MVLGRDTPMELLVLLEFGSDTYAAERQVNSVNLPPPNWVGFPSQVEHFQCVTKMIIESSCNIVTNVLM